VQQKPKSVTVPSKIGSTSKARNGGSAERGDRYQWRGSGAGEVPALELQVQERPVRQSPLGRPARLVSALCLLLPAVMHVVDRFTRYCCVSSNAKCMPVSIYFLSVFFFAAILNSKDP